MRVVEDLVGECSSRMLNPSRMHSTSEDSLPNSSPTLAMSPTDLGRCLGFSVGIWCRFCLLKLLENDVLFRNFKVLDPEPGT